MKRLAILLAALPLLAYPQTIILHDGVAVTYCGGEWTVDRVYHWPCVIFRGNFDRGV